MLKTQEYSIIVGETYHVVRNVYGREGRAPRNPGPRGEAADFADGKHRRFVFADALAWRITRELCALGMEWDKAAEIVRLERPADAFLSEDYRDKPQFFAVWPTSGDSEKFAAHLGEISEISEIVEFDAETYGPVHPIRMISVDVAQGKAIALMEAAGYQLIDGEIEVQTAP
jgi:hypothetical protein